MSDISIFLPDLRGGGAERVQLDLAHEFTRLGHRVSFVLMQAVGEYLPEAQANFDVHSLGVARVRRVPVALGRYLRSHHPDALLAAMWPLTTVAPLVARLFGFRGRIVVSEHAILSAQYTDRGRIHDIALQASMALGYRFANARIGVSEGVVRDMSKLAHFSEKSFQAIYNPVASRPTPNLRALAAIDSLWGVEQGGRILTVGRFKKVKNHPLLLRAFAELSQRLDARLMFLGTGQGQEMLSLMADQLGIADRVIFAGFDADPTPFYITADLFVLSSDNEGFGNVIVEALACGTPVVSTDCPSGPAEILKNGQFGTLVPVNDVSALAKAMNASLSAHHNVEALKRRAADFNPKHAAERYLEILLP